MGKTRREKTVPDTEFVVVTTTIDNEGAARELARSAVTARLAACGQVGSPVTSVYWWDHAVRELTEWTVSLKTTPYALCGARRAHPGGPYVRSAGDRRDTDHG